MIDAILEDDKTRPAKQRHTAKRVWERLREEHQFTGGYTIVKDYMRSATPAWATTHRSSSPLRSATAAPSPRPPYISMNELTTVAAAYALNNITVTPTEISACAGQTSCSVSFATAAMAVAFANVSNLVSLAAGSALSTTPAGGGVVPTSTLNTLGDIIATCVNSNGTVSATGLNGGPPPCYSLFSISKTSAGAMPTDTSSPPRCPTTPSSTPSAPS